MTTKPTIHPPDAPPTLALDGLPYLTPESAPIGGVIRERPEDFLVEEIPLYDPCGEGEHIYVLGEKREMTTSEAVSVLAHHFGVPARAVGIAGLKDKHAITRQVFSIHVPGRSIGDFGALRHERLAILWADMHTNKLRLGHLRGNRFSIRIRRVNPTDVLRAHQILKTLHRRGAPNYFAQQRFGYMNTNHILGRCLIARDHRGFLDALLGPATLAPVGEQQARECYARGEYQRAFERMPMGARTEREALRVLAGSGSEREAVNRAARGNDRLWVHAWQSDVFNRVLAARLKEGMLEVLRAGDLAWKHDSGAVFAVDEPTARDPATAERLSCIEISPSGPLWGVKMTRAAGETDERECGALADQGLMIEHLERAARVIGRTGAGARRSLRCPVIDPEIEAGADEHGAFIRTAFELPPGCFATAILREIMKDDSGLNDDVLDAEEPSGDG